MLLRLLYIVYKYDAFTYAQTDDFRRQDLDIAIIQYISPHHCGLEGNALRSPRLQQLARLDVSKRDCLFPNSCE
jgi:hypothetical protein